MHGVMKRRTGHPLVFVAKVVAREYGLDGRQRAEFLRLVEERAVEEGLMAR